MCKARAFSKHRTHGSLDLSSIIMSESNMLNMNDLPDIWRDGVIDSYV